MSESVMVRLPVYRTPDGKPTCYSGADQCAMLGVNDTDFWCGYDGADLYPNGPSPSCPLWSHADRGPGYTHSGDNGVDCGCRK